jgi:putative sensory transduction regulator
MRFRTLIAIAFAIAETPAAGQVTPPAEPTAQTASPAAPATDPTGPAMDRPTPATNQMITGSDAVAIAEILRGENYNAELRQSEIGPYIAGSDSGLSWLLLFLSCTDGKDCLSVQFYAGFAKTVSLERINTWNRTKRYVRAYLDEEKDAIIEMDVNLDGGGVSRENFKKYVKFWIALLHDFDDHIRPQQDPTQQ